MSRTLELGRAVIAMPSASIELWLTTLITLSPSSINSSAQHSGVDLQEPETDALLDCFSSGHVWVKGGSNMHMSFDCSRFGALLSSHYMQQLGVSIVNAQAWNQFGLCLSLPLNHEPTNGRLRVNIERYREDTPVPPNTVSVRPPDSISVFNLDSIQFTMAISKSNKHAIARKRPKREAAKSTSAIDEAETLFESANYGTGSSCISGPIRSCACSRETVCQCDTTHDETRPVKTPSSSDCDPMPDPPMRGKRKEPAAKSAPNNIKATEDASSDTARVIALTDAALRFSICLNLRGHKANLKVKANTFVHSLASIAPSLWRIGHASTCAHVMGTAPILACSLDRLGFSSSSSALKSKIAELKMQNTGEGYRKNSVNRNLFCDSTSTTLADRLWCHVQRTQLSKPAPALVSSLCDPAFQITSVDETAEILEERRGLGVGPETNNSELVYDLPCRKLLDTSAYISHSDGAISSIGPTRLDTEEFIGGNNMRLASTFMDTCVSQTLGGESITVQNSQSPMRVTADRSVSNTNEITCTISKSELRLENEVFDARMNHLEDFLFDC